MIEKIEKILEVQNNNLLSLWPFIREYSPDMDEHGNIFFKKGEAPYDCFVAHLDTVHGGKPDIIRLGEYIASRNAYGIGGDDKCGIIACLTLIGALKNVKIVFFEGEERGCIGSKAFDKTFFNDCKYVIGIDRKNSNDFITEISFTKLCSEEFYQEFKALNPSYKEEKGLMTDVSTLKRSVNLCMANISSGYYNPHTKDEYINLKHLNQTINALYRFSSANKNKIWEHEDSSKNNYYNNRGYGKSKSSQLVSPYGQYYDTKTGKMYTYDGHEVESDYSAEEEIREFENNFNIKKEESK